ncbi:hypothetical protein DVJ78_13750 [Humibacter sp. BT305]|nr:hypothetical protein DVJ78_13750 [Humibacter sp. BT305]
MSFPFHRPNDTGRLSTGTRRVRTVVVVAAAAAAFALVSLTAIVPPGQAPGALSDMADGSVAAGSVTAAAPQADVVIGVGDGPGQQTISVPQSVAQVLVSRDGYSGTTALDKLRQSGTNRDWAELVMIFGGFPRTESNITVMLRWMRQENGPDDWWLRNNPLNNGWGSGGGSGLGSYDNLVIAAENCAEALHENSGYSAILAGFQSSAPTSQIEAAIWASPWASSHYANGAHWSSSPVPLYTAPAAAWG